MRSRGLRSGRARLHLAAALASGVLVAGVCLTGDNPRVALGGRSSDHYSHTMATILFFDRGVQIYRRPIRELCARGEGSLRRAREVAAPLRVLPQDVCWPSASPQARPLIINWQHFPRPYPPGQLLYFLPEALLYRFAGARFDTVNRITILKLGLAAHVCWVMLAVLLSDLRPRGIAWGVLAISYVQLLHWALRGMYDAISLVGVVLALLFLRRGRPLSALVAFAWACFSHFRALWYLPLLLPIAVELHRTGVLRDVLGGSGPRARLRAGLPMAVAALMLGASCVAFLWLWPALMRLPERNPLHYPTLEPLSSIGLSFLLPSLGVAALLVAQRAWWTVLSLGWLVGMLLASPTFMPWHTLFLLPILLVPSIESRAEARGGQVFLVTLWYFSALEMIFRFAIWPGWIAEWLERVGLV